MKLHPKKKKRASKQTEINRNLRAENKTLEKKLYGLELFIAETQGYHYVYSEAEGWKKGEYLHGYCVNRKAATEYVRSNRKKHKSYEEIPETLQKQHSEENIRLEEELEQEKSKSWEELRKNQALERKIKDLERDLAKKNQELQSKCQSKCQSKAQPKAKARSKAPPLIVVQPRKIEHVCDTCEGTTEKFECPNHRHPANNYYKCDHFCDECAQITHYERYDCQNNKDKAIKRDCQEPLAKKRKMAPQPAV